MERFVVTWLIMVRQICDVTVTMHISCLAGYHVPIVINVDQILMSIEMPDIHANRHARNYSVHEYVLRALWGVGQWLVFLSPRPAFFWRRWILRMFGAEIGSRVNIYPSTKIYMPWNVEIGDWSALGEDVFLYSLGRITIGKKVTISYRAHLCAGTHDLGDPSLPLEKRPIRLADGVWVGTEAFIGPGVMIDKMAVVGARAVVTKSIEQNQIVVGNPCKVVGMRTM